MRILYISTVYLPAIGGAQTHLHYLAKTIKGMGNEVDLLTHTSLYRRDWLRLSTVFSEKEMSYEYEGIQVSQIGFPLSVRIRMVPWALIYYGFFGPSVRNLSKYMIPYIERFSPSPDLLHATRIGREFIVRASLDFAHKHGLPFVLTPNHHPRWRGILYKEYDKIYREADAVLALTAEEQRLLIEEKGVREERIHITGVGPVLSENYSAEEFRARYNIKDRFVLYVGQQLKYKGIASILEAAPIVWKKHPDLKFVFIGPSTSYSEKLFGQIQDKRIVNLGPVDLESKTSALAACEFLCMPSSQESFGGVYVEAWSLRKAVIGGRIPPIECLVEHGRDGLLSSQISDELADAIVSLLSNPLKSKAMGDAGWAKVQNNYTWDKIAEKTFSVYKRLCS